MADTDILIDVSAVGAESVAKVNTNLNGLNTSLSKQVPIMRELNPLLGTMGLGFLGSATAIGALVTGATMLNSVYESWLKSSVNYALASNQLTKSTVSYSDAIEVSKKLSDEYLVSQQKIQDNFPTLEAVTGDFSTAVGFMADALKLSTKYGVDLEKVTKDLAAAWEGKAGLRDARGGLVPGGPQGIAAMEAKYTGMGMDKTISIQSQIDSAAKKVFSDDMKAFGKDFHDIWTSMEKGYLLLNRPYALFDILNKNAPSSSNSPVTIHNYIQLDGQTIGENVTNYQETKNNLRGATGQ